MISLLLVFGLAVAQIKLPEGHVNIQEALLAGTKAPSNHVAINSLLGLTGHQNVDDLIKAGTVLPKNHINVDSRFTYEKAAGNTTATVPPAQKRPSTIVVILPLW
jgi:hypothetical protein